jgi:AcrR family transcriptional regulator
MGIHERRERERTDTREKILDAARELFAAKGFDGVSMRQVAEKIEYSPTAIYVHFKNKEELFRELCQEDFRRLSHSFQSTAKIADPVERIRRTGQAYIEFGVNYPNHYRLMFMTPHPFPLEAGETEMQECGKGNPEEDAYAFLRLAVADAMSAGWFRPELNDVDLLAQTLWAGVHGVVSLQIAKRGDPWLEWRSLKERSELMIDTLFRGLARPKQEKEKE